MNIATAMKLISSYKLTENGAFAYTTTFNPLLDLFATIGACRNRSEEDIVKKFIAAYRADRELAVRTLFYARDVRGGLGERRAFRVCLKWLANVDPVVVTENMGLIPFYGRWDDLFVLLDTEAQSAMIDYVHETLKSDMSIAKGSLPNKLITGLAKWMPSENTSSPHTAATAKKMRKLLGYTPREYRKMLSTLRKALNIVEKNLTEKTYDNIEYSAVPSLAMKKYKDAFSEKDSIRFAEYLAQVRLGKTKINASTLYPYNLVEEYIYKPRREPDPTIEEQWEALPDYAEGCGNILVMCDMSGSMSGRPMATSAGLGIYFAKRNTSIFKDMVLTFSRSPHFFDLSGIDTLYGAVDELIEGCGNFMNTNLEKAFYFVLNAAIEGQVASSEMPKAIVVISDMEIDPFFRNPNSLDFVDHLKEIYNSAGYELPKLILWNVDARQDTFLTQNDEVIYVSGQSASVFKQFCGNLNGKTAVELMLETIGNERYDKIKF